MNDCVYAIIYLDSEEFYRTVLASDALFESLDKAKNHLAGLSLADPYANEKYEIVALQVIK